MNRTGFQSLLKATAATRQSLFGVVDDNNSPVLLDYDNGLQSFQGYYTPVKSQQQLDAIGFKDVHDSVVRFSKDVPFIPQLGKKIRITEGERIVTLQLSEFGSHPINPEYVIGCKALA